MGKKYHVRSADAGYTLCGVAYEGKLGSERTVLGWGRTVALLDASNPIIIERPRIICAKCFAKAGT